MDLLLMLLLYHGKFWTGEFDGGSVVSVTGSAFALADVAENEFLARLNGPLGDAVAVSLA